MTNLNTMPQHTHHLPKHLGAWPCTIDDTGGRRAIVTYDAGPDGAHTIDIPAALLTPIRPDEPDWSYALDDNGQIWQWQQRADASTEWRNTVSGSVLTWTQLWDINGPIRPLAEIPNVTVPFHLVGALDSDQIRVTWMANPVIIRTVVEGKYESQSADLTPDEAELFAAALLDAARKARAHLASNAETEAQVWKKFGEHVTETDRPLADPLTAVDNFVHAVDRAMARDGAWTDKGLAHVQVVPSAFGASGDDRGRATGGIVGKLPLIGEGDQP